MTLTIELTPEQEARLQAAAKKSGTNPETLLLDLVEALPVEDADAPRTLEGYGALKNVGGSVDDFLREKHAETAREEAAA